MKPLTIQLNYAEGASLHRVVQGLRDLVRGSGATDRPVVIIGAGEPSEAHGIAGLLRQVGVQAEVHSSLALDDAPAFERPPIPRKDVLLGTDTLPAWIAINGEQIQLGTIVAKAYEMSGLSVADWNRMGQESRDEFIDAAMEAIRMQDPTEPEHEITRAEFAAAFEAKQKEVADRKIAEALSAQANAEHADVLEDEKGDAPAIHANLVQLDFAADIQKADSTEATQGGQDATGPTADGSEAIGSPPYDLGVEATTTTDGSASE